jgi:hypothetical protein
MTFAESILSELAEADAVEKWRAIQDGTLIPAQATRQLTSTNARMLALLRTELLHVGTVTCVVSSIMNAIEGKIFEQIKTEHARSFTPGFSSSFIEHIDKLNEQTQFFELGQTVQILMSHLSMAKNLMKAYVAASDCEGSELVLSCEVVADSWRRVCRATLRVHEILTEDMRQGGYTCPEAVEADTLNLLRSSERGGWPCITRKGQISIPGWAERRVEPRTELNVRIQISKGPARFPATIKNATTIGFGIDSAIGVANREVIVIHLDDGRDLLAMVCWGKDGMFGVRLYEPLESDDWLLHS